MEDEERDPTLETATAWTSPILWSETVVKGRSLAKL
jgi:hypothetical protein